MKKGTLTLVLSFVLAAIVTGCGQTNEGNGQTAAAAPSASETPAEVKKIIVGTGTQFPKVAYLDENGKLTGFDVELVREIDKRLPQYEFELQTLEFSNILLSLETGKIDFGAHQFEKNPERTEKYLFNQEPYAYWETKIVVAKDNDSIQTLDDLAGKKVLSSPTSAEAQILENYNKSHDKKIEIVYQSGAAGDTVSQVASGRVDATLGADFVLPLIDPDGKLKTVGGPLTQADILFIFRKNDPESQKLADDIDTAIKEIKADGTLSKLSIEWLGQDFTS